MLQERETILEEASKDKNPEADIPWSRFLKDDRLPSFRDCLRQEDLQDITNLWKMSLSSISEH